MRQREKKPESPSVNLGLTDKAASSDASDALPLLNNVLQSEGQPLETPTRTAMEARFGHDFSQIRIFADEQAAASADAFNADAYTFGPRIVFGPGEYNPETPDGQALIAHELAHVVQQTYSPPAAPLSGGLALSQPGDTAEQSADQLAAAALDGGPSARLGTPAANAPSLVASAAPTTIQRKVTSTPSSDDEELRRRLQRPAAEPAAADGAAADPALPNTAAAEPTLAEADPDATAAASATTTPAPAPAAQPSVDTTALAAETASGAAADGATEQLPAPAVASADEADRAAEPSPTPADQGASADHPQGEAAITERASKSPTPTDSPAQTSAAETFQAAAASELQTLKAATQVLPLGAPAAPGNRLTLSAIPEAQQLQEALAANAAPPELTGIDPAVQARAAAAAQAAEAASAALAATESDAAAVATTEVQFAEPEPAAGPGLPIFRQVAEPVEDEALFIDEAELAERRAAASGMVSGFLASAAGRAQTLTALGQTLPFQLLPLAETAKTTLLAGVTTQQALLAEQLGQLRSQAERAAQSARDQITQQYDAAVSAIQSATTTARDQISAAYTATLDALSEREQTQLDQITQLYTQADSDYRALGVTVGGEALAIGQEEAANYRAGRINRDDSFLDGPLTDNRCEARADAAMKVAQGYNDGLIAEANAQADHARQGQSQDIATVQSLVSQSRESLDAQHRATLESLVAMEQQALSQAADTQSSLLDAVEQTLQATLASLTQQETSAVTQLQTSGDQQVLQLDQAAQQSIAQLQEQLTQAASGLVSALQGIPGAVSGMQVPDIESLSGALDGALGQVDGTLATIQGQIEAALATTGQQLTQVGQQALAALTALGQGVTTEATTTSEGLTTSLSELGTAATTAFTQLQTTHTTTVNESATAAVEGFRQVDTGITTAFTQINTNLTQGFTASLTALGEGLRGVFPEMRQKIASEADSAAAQVQPRWKGIMKWVLIIAVVVVVALVIGPFVIGAVGAAAGALGASAAVAGAIGTVVGGAIVGAATGATMQVIDNWASGRDLMEGVVQAAVMGAIGGALGGAAGLAIKNVGSAVARFALETVADVVIDTGLNLATGQFSWDALGMSLLSSVAMNKFTSGLSSVRGVDSFQGRMFSAGESVGTSVGTRVRSDATALGSAMRDGMDAVGTSMRDGFGGPSLAYAAADAGGSGMPRSRRSPASDIETTHRMVDADGNGGRLRPDEADATPLRPDEVDATPLRPDEADATPLRPDEADATPIRPDEAGTPSTKPLDAEQVEGTPLRTGSDKGLDPNPETIRQGTVRMEEHPDYPQVLRELQDAGFDVKSTNGSPYVEVLEVVDVNGNVLRVEKTVYLQPNMRYLDLEHELGHVRQIVDRFNGEIPPTRRVVQLSETRIKESKTKKGLWTDEQNAIMEYHNRLDEYLRLQERGVDPEILAEHARGVEVWREAYEDSLRKGVDRNGVDLRDWNDQHFGDLADMEARYNNAVRTPRQDGTGSNRGNQTPLAKDDDLDTPPQSDEGSTPPRSDADSVEAQRIDRLNQLVDSIGNDVKNHPLRAEYETKVSELADRAAALRAQGLSSEEIAMQMWRARRELGVQYKDVTPKPLRDYIYAVNSERYGDPLGPSWDFLVNKYNGDFDAIIAASTRPNPDVNRLLGGFREWLHTTGDTYLPYAPAADPRLRQEDTDSLDSDDGDSGSRRRPLSKDDDPVETSGNSADLDATRARLENEYAAELAEYQKLRELYDSSMRSQDPNVQARKLQKLEQQLADVRENTPRLNELMQQYPLLNNFLGARPTVRCNLCLKPKAMDVLEEVLQQIARDGADSIIQQGSRQPDATPLTEAQQAISSQVAQSVPKNSNLQPGFDPSRRRDPAYMQAYLDQLYRQAAEITPELQALTTQIAAATGGKPGFREEPKDRTRAQEKVDKYKGDASLLTDLAGSKIEYQSLDQLYQGLAQLTASPVKIVYFEDRFINPQQSGYRDIMMNIRMSNGHVAEFRLHLAQIDAVADFEHALYEVRRSLKDVAKEQGRAKLTPEEDALQIALINEEQRLFWQALQQALGPTAE